MAQFVFLISLVFIVVLNFAQSSNYRIESSIEVINVSNLRQFSIKNRSVRLASHNETLSSNESFNIQKRYKIGQRVESNI